VVSLSAGGRRRHLLCPPGVEQQRSGNRRGRYDAPERRLRLPALLGARFVRQAAARAGGGGGAGAGARTGAPRGAREPPQVLVTLVGDVSTNYFLLRELDLQLEISRQTLRTNDDTVTYFRNRLDGGVSNRLELDRIVANRARTATAIPDIERQIGTVENLIS